MTPITTPESDLKPKLRKKRPPLVDAFFASTLSALALVSGFFSIAALIPAVNFTFGAGRNPRVFVFFILFGTTLLSATYGWGGSGVFLAVVGIPSFCVHYYSRRPAFSFNRILFSSLIAQVLSVALFLVGYAYFKTHSLHVLTYWREQFAHFQATLFQTLPKSVFEMLGIEGTEPEVQTELRQMMVRAPGRIISFLILSVWIGLTFNLRARLRLKLPAWRVPLAWLWLCAATWALALFGKGDVGEFCLHLLFGFATLYVLQGLLVLSSLMTHFKIFGMFRFMTTLFVFVFALPLLGVLGLSEVWFDFRNRFRHF